MKLKTVEVDGKTYAIPMLLARWVMFYNIELFAEHGKRVG